MRRQVRFVIAVLLASVTLPSAQATESEENCDGTDRFCDHLQKVTSAGGVVVSDSPQAAQVGLDVLNRKGNAVDAAIAMTFAVGVTRPDNCGIGAGGHLVYRGADTSIAALDFRESAPGAMNQNTFNQGEADPANTEVVKPGIHTEGSGHTVVGVPGVVAGMDEARRRLGSGSFTLAELIGPAERLAREGIKVTWGLQLAAFFHESRFVNYPETQRVYGVNWAKHGPFFRRPAGQEDDTVFKQEDYARSLRQIMKHGPRAFYQVSNPESGDGLDDPSIGARIVSAMKDAEANARINPVLMGKTNGEPNDIGLIEAEDLASYTPKWKQPLVSQYRNHQVIAMPPPAGGMVAIEMLNLLENFKLRSFGRSSTDHLHVLAEAQKLAWADRIKYLADPDLVTVPTKELTSKGYARQRVSEIDMTTAKTVNDYSIEDDGKKTTLDPQPQRAHTTHLSVIDRHGNAVAVTCSLNYSFGSSVVPPGAGFLLNNQLADFNWTWPNDAAPPANAPAGKKIPRSAQSPTIVVKDGQPVLVTGGAGGPTIISGAVQNILNVVDFNLNVFHAIDAPRIDAANANLLWVASGQQDNRCSDGENPTGGEDPGTPWLALEQNRIVDSEQLKLRGHKLLCVDSSDGYLNLPGMQSAGTNIGSGQRVAVSDPRAFSPEFNMFDDQGPMGQTE